MGLLLLPLSDPPVFGRASDSASFDTVTFPRTGRCPEPDSGTAERATATDSEFCASEASTLSDTGAICDVVGLSAGMPACTGESGDRDECIAEGGLDACGAEGGLDVCCAEGGLDGICCGWRRFGFALGVSAESL